MDGGHGTGLREERLGQVEQLVERPDGGAVPGAAAGSRLSALRSRLRVAHARCETVDGASWAGYVVDLDRGIDELHVELAMVAQRPVAGPGVDDVLLARTSALELDAWRLAADAGPAGPGATDLPAALATAGAALARYRESLTSAPETRAWTRARAELEDAMAGLRRTGSGAVGEPDGEAPAGAPADA